MKNLTTSTRRKVPTILALICVFSLDAAPALCISATEINAGIVFNFSAPGARSLALGGAFVGLADDATAAYVNPAGLTLLSRPQLSTEVRSTRLNAQLQRWRQAQRGDHRRRH